ncbi:hypothetical protein POM88_008809 [Heracleum sosnowskyi]|uniref:Uncharacterized protein n=1 Tax=Heracleum sosnowskyi TaxID=360622 RepID=A0AAD8J862_9APIA|nr:hypothetical protein POM88_008809 [Heracleum sosnowskyi]
MKSTQLMRQKSTSRNKFLMTEKTSNSSADKLGDVQREASPTSSRISTTDGEGTGLSSVDIIEFRVGKSKSEHGKITSDGNKVEKLMDIPVYLIDENKLLQM